MPQSGLAHYYELTNMEESATIDVRDFRIKHLGWWMPYPTGGGPQPNTLVNFADVVPEEDAMLAPGESFVICGRWEGLDDDGYPIHRVELVEKSDLHIYAGESADEDIEHDSISTSIWWIRNPDGEEGKVLWYKSSPTDSVDVDAINNWVDPATNSLQTENPQEKLEELFNIRDPLYRETADIIIDTGKDSVRLALKEILEKLQE